MLTHIALRLLEVDYLKAGLTDALKNPEKLERNADRSWIFEVKSSFRFLQADLKI